MAPIDPDVMRPACSLRRHRNAVRLCAL